MLHIWYPLSIHLLIKLSDPAHWTVSLNRREFFENFSREKGFDPLIPENWYNKQILKQLLEIKVRVG
jgi:hypothetical protein